VGTANTEYLYDLNGNVISELNASTWLNVYLRLNGGLFAQYTVGGPRTQFVHADHLGSTRLLTSMTQSIVDSLDYLPFGEQTAGDTGTTHKFTSKERDSESNLDNFGARYDSSSMGRFMSPDPMGNYFADGGYPQSWNMYSYALNNPLSFIDPTGMYTCVYLTDDSQGIESVDGNSSAQECQDTGGSEGVSDQTITVKGNTNQQSTDNGSIVSLGSFSAAPIGFFPSWVTNSLQSACTGTATAVGELLGAGMGAQVGAEAGFGAGAIGGTGAEPGGGTLVGGGGGALLGGLAGGYFGWRVGDAAGRAMGTVLCSKGSWGSGASGGGDNQRANKSARDAKTQAERETGGKKMTPRQEEQYHDTISGMHYSYDEMVTVAKEILEGRSL
jgi:RHS repeat-associated protein